MADFLMPSLGADMEAGTLVRWRKQPGEGVKRGEIMAEVETEKGVIEVEAFTEGVVTAHLVAPGAKVPVGTPLAALAERTPEVPSPLAPALPATEPAPWAPAIAPAPTVPKSASAEPLPARALSIPPHATPAARRVLREQGIPADSVHGTGSHGVITREDVTREAVRQHPREFPQAGSEPPAAGRVAVSPRARRLAEQHGVAPESLVGTGPQGSVVAADVELAIERARRALEQAGARPASGAQPSEAKARMRHAIAQAMSRSKREIPHYYLSHVVDLAPVLEWLRQENEGRPPAERLLSGVLFVRAVARALRQFPELNAHYLADGARMLADVHVGVAVSLRGGGLVAPAIAHADQLSIEELSRAFKDVVNRARTGMLTSSEMALPTITITSLGERGVEAVFPVIIPPQVAMVGFGAIAERAMVVGTTVAPRPAVTVTLAADHRVSDGHRGGLFLAAVTNILKEAPHESRRTAPRDLSEPHSYRA